MRRAVQQFAADMEAKLKTKDEDRGDNEWLNSHTTINMLLACLDNEFREARNAYEECNPIELAGECVDVANFAMMISDRLKYNNLLIEGGEKE